jgi:Ca2+/Na+ antiporter
MILVWTKFAICAALIGLAGPVLTRYGDIIAGRTGVSRTWIGLVLLATATSLPELFTGISAVTVAEQIMKEALNRSAELLVMGAYGHSRMRQIVFGGATWTVLKSPRLPILLSQ